MFLVWKQTWLVSSLTAHQDHLRDVLILYVSGYLFW